MWNELVTAALIGTERRALKLENVPEPFHDLAAGLADQEPERALLALAGAMALYRRAGQAPGIDSAPPLEACDRDDLPPYSPRAGLILGQILGLSAKSEHLTEWFAAAAGAGQRVIEEYLPRLLTYFERRPNLPEYFYDVIGKRGRWLARQNSAWAYAILPENDAEWELSALPARLHYLRRLRASDAAHGRALAESVWKSENAETRGALLRAFEVGLSLGDEAFLEAALDDHAAGVQVAASLMLASLRGSAYSERMIERAERLIRIGWKQQLLGKKLLIDVALPETCDESMIRDGILEKSPIVEIGTRAFWLSSLAAKLPGAFWLSGDWSAPELVAAVKDSGEWGDLLLSAVAQIAQREQNGGLAEALLNAEPDGEGERWALKAAPPAAREAYVLRALSAARQAHAHGRAVTLLEELSNTDQRWSRTLTLTFLDAVRQIAPRQSSVEVNSLASYLPMFAMRMSPDCLPQLQALANVDNKNKYAWTNGVKRAAATLEFRRDTLREFSR